MKADLADDENSGRLPNAGSPPLLTLEGITKTYSGAKALDGVDFDVRPGEVHVLFGENGAGKSTLISIVAGAIRPDAGRLLFRGEPVDIFSVQHARSLGISAVFQEFSLVPQLSIEENLFLGSEETTFGVLDKSATRKRASELLDQLGFSLRATQRVAYLSRAEQQMVEIAKAFRADLSVLILDEPTASLTDKETDQLFALIDQLRSQGVGIIYITHRINEIRKIGDRITVLRDGCAVGTVGADISETDLVGMMTGRIIDQIFPSVRYRPRERVIETRGLATADGAIKDISLHVAKGEIVGLAGLVGSGKSDIARACFGLIPVSSGSVHFEGVETTGKSPRAMLDAGFFYVPSDRREEGLMMMRCARESIALPALSTPEFSKGFALRRRAESERANELAKKLNLQPRNIERTVEHFSGGNQQKILLAKSLTRKVKLFVFDEPTVGVDVGTRVAIYRFIGNLCENGAAVLLISSDMPEILHLTRRVYVMCRGALTAELTGDQITQENVLRHCFEREAA
ncbi:MAG: sugar ABC transporter ATP-binding protein [Albidovulum sp.]|nr:sugar ABC transporter ATP-binding protein [Albidovulum sp.]